MKRGIEIFLKGMCMGSADIIPGVSGGTVALILGIYEELVFSIKSVDLRAIPYAILGLFYKEYREKTVATLKSIRWRFLIPLVTGIASAFFLIANVIDFLISLYRSFIYSFFTGLIVASAFIIILRTERFKLHYLLFIIVGVLSASIILGFTQITLNHSLPVIFLSGVVAACAMILPGISGAFMMVFLGQYEYMLSALKDINMVLIITYLLGAVLGVVSFSHFLSKLIKDYKGETLSFLTGLMLGGLRGSLQNINPEDSPIMIAIFLLAGLSLVIVVEYLGRMRNGSRTGKTGK